MDPFLLNSPLRRYLATIEPATPGDGEPGGTGGGDAPALPPAASDRTFTQEELNRHAGRAREDGRKAAEQAVADALGVPIDDAKKIIADRKAAEDAQKTEADKLREQLAQANATATQAQADAAKATAESNTRLALVAAGMPAENINDFLPAVGVDVTEDPAARTQRVEAWKTKHPALFISTGQATAPPPAPGINPPRPPANSGAPKTGIEAGRELARQKAASATKVEPFANFKPAGL